MDFSDLEAILKFVGRENLSIILGFYLLKRLINGLVPSLHKLIDAKISLMNFRMSGRTLKRREGEEPSHSSKPS
jgi:hypothetical protein